MKLQHKQAILFDLDGTLIDSAPDLASAINRMLEQLDRSKFSEETIRGWVGNGAVKLVQRALVGQRDVRETIPQDLQDRAVAIFLHEYSQGLINKSRLYQGVKETLEKLADQGFTLALVTNKPAAFIAPILEGTAIDHLFTATLGGDSLAKKKPDPLPLRHMCAELKIAVEQAVMVGDSKNDILAARACAIQSIGVSYGYNYGEDIATYGPDAVVDHFSDILRHFESPS
jgi:phosphoglycolate phosphatase